ncbi:MAG: Gfo/Idh/MocA family oxidoreductase [Defluviitaleaceae bacterium]|nr:Gfo/Idh/MocA family oxidoreductase [Defluviitaleaceae bacterium]
MAVKRIKAALIGSGAISGIYLKNLTKTFHIVDLVGCSDIIPERSAKRAEEFGIRQMTNQEIYEDKSIEIVVNTTYPTAHYTVNKEALLAGKHVYCEKMIAVKLEEGKELIDLAHDKGLQFTMAPDTFLGGGWQSARYYIDHGFIGEPVSATATCIRDYSDNGASLGPQLSFVYLPGGGIPFDMGGYYLHAFINLFGPMSRVTGFAKTRGVKKFTNPRHPKYGEALDIQSPNTMNATLEFANGVYANLLLTSESALFPTPIFEVYGTEGHITLFDPNNHGGPITLHRKSGDAAMPLVHGLDVDGRGIGVVDMAYAIKNGRRPRAHAEMGYHAFEVIHGVINCTQTNQVHIMQSTCERPAAVRRGQIWGEAHESFLDD